MIGRRLAGRVIIGGLVAAGLTLSGNVRGAEPGRAALDPHAQHHQMLDSKSPSKQAAAAHVTLLDSELVTQDGVRVKLKSDVVGDRIVVIDFVYTTCTTVCPVLSAILGQVQKRLGERLGREVVMVSISVDPIRDTPPRLKAYSAKHHAREGWVWLTGDKSTVDQVVKELGAYTPNFQDHPSMVLVGDGGSGSWARFLGFPGPDQIMAKVNEFSDGREAGRSLAAVRE